MIYKIHTTYLKKWTHLLYSVLEFDTNDNILAKGNRNQIKIANLNGVSVAIKSFKIPNFVNRIVYKYFRKSKARRSYEHAQFLLKKNIGTPVPIAYFKNYNALGILDTYYLCEHINADLTLRELIIDKNNPDYDIILKQFTQFTYKLHENGIEFLDHSSGNTLIKKVSKGVYQFFLVDLNRMKFHTKMSFTKRMKNLKRLTRNKEVIKIISKEYSKLSGDSPIQVYTKITRYTALFFQKFDRKRKLKTFLSL